VPIAAFVTSYGRVFMDAVRDKLYPEGVFYQSTDSLLLDRDNWGLLDAAGLCGEDKLGLFREEAIHEWVDIQGNEVIDRPRKPKRGGLPRKAVPKGNNIYEHERWEGPWTGIARGNYSSVSILRVLSELRPIYTRQGVRDDGRCEPWSISNWQLAPEEQRRKPISRQGDRRGKHPLA